MEHEQFLQFELAIKEDGRGTVYLKGFLIESIVGNSEDDTFVIVMASGQAFTIRWLAGFDSLITRIRSFCNKGI
jgi:hypothetical protein